MINWIKSKILIHSKQLIKYSIFGLISFFVDFLLTYILIKNTQIHYLISSTIGYIVGVMISYYFSITWVFSKRNLKDFWHLELGIFILIEIVALLLMNVVMFFSTDYLKFGFLLSKLIGNFIAFIWNYLIKHFFLFRANPTIKNDFLNWKKELYKG